MTDQEEPDLKPLIAEWQRRLTNLPGEGGFQPGLLLASCLARVVGPSEVLFCEWLTTEGSGFEQTRGSLFALVASFAVEAEWVNVPTGQHASQGGQQHSMDMVIHPLTEQPTVRLHLENVHAQYPSTEVGAVTLEGTGWSQALPLKKRYQQNVADYFQEVRRAVAEACAAPNG